MSIYGTSNLMYAPFVAFVIAAASAPAPESSDIASSEPPKLLIATKAAPPFSFKNGKNWTGISISLLNRIAKIEGFRFELKEMTLDELIKATGNKEVDAVAAALTVTAQREQVVDFTHPFHSSGLGIVVRSEEQSAWLELAHRFISLAFLEAVGALFLLLAIIGTLIWLAERHHNPHFPPSSQGIGAGLWWSAVTMTTVGYGDKAPVTTLGRFLALIWMFASIVLISSFTAAITTSLTVGQLRRSIHSLEDLRGRPVVTLKDSTSSTFLDAERVEHTTSSSLNEALKLVQNQQVEAIVYDVPILQHALRSPQGAGLQLLPIRFARQDYGLALPDGSPYRERWNRIILSLIESPEWQTVLDSYLGEQHN